MLDHGGAGFVIMRAPQESAELGDPACGLVKGRRQGRRRVGLVYEAIQACHSCASSIASHGRDEPSACAPLYPLAGLFKGVDGHRGQKKPGDRFRPGRWGLFIGPYCP